MVNLSFVQYKGSAGTDQCTACPVGTYNGQTGSPSAALCLACPVGSVTEQEASTDISACVCSPQTYLSVDATGASTCQQCPTGALCSGSQLTCALRNDGQTCPGSGKIVGTWVKGTDGIYSLSGCPAGHQRQTDQCVPCAVCTTGKWCARADYITDSNALGVGCQVRLFQMCSRV